MDKLKKKMYLLGAAAGLANGLFGSGGGIIAVPMLKSIGYETKKAHACSLGITLPLSVVSVMLYMNKNTTDIKTALELIPFGLVGAITGTVLMKKIKPHALTRIFAVMLIAAGWRSLFL